MADVLAAVKNLPAGNKIYILVPFKQHAKRNIKEELNILLQKGFSRIYISALSSKKSTAKNIETPHFDPKRILYILFIGKIVDD